MIFSNDTDGKLEAHYLIPKSLVEYVIGLREGCIVINDNLFDSHIHETRKFKA